MPGGTETIREFLVKLGYQQDEAALKRFTGGITTATKAVFKLAAAVEGTAVLVAAGIARFTSNLEALYFAAQRTGSSAQALRAMDRAAQDFGATAGEMLGSIEGLAQALRMNPGNAGLLQSLGVHLQRTKTGAIDTTNAMMQLSGAFQKVVADSGGQLYVAEQYAQMLGINEHTLLALLDPDFTAQVQRTMRLMDGVDWAKITKDAHEFQNQLRDTWTLLETIGAGVTENFLKKFGFESLEQFNTWLATHKDEIIKRINEVIDTIITGAKFIRDRVFDVIAKFKEWDEKTNGLSTKLLLLAGLLKVTGAGSIIGGLIALAAQAPGILLLATALTSVYTAAKSLRAFQDGRPAGNFVSDVIAPGLRDWMTNSFENIHNFFHRDEQAYRYFRSKGWSDAAARGLMANLQAESHYDPNAINPNGIAYGVAQWGIERQADFARLMGRDIHGSSFEDQLKFMDWELRNRAYLGGKLLANAQTPEDAARVVSQYYERPEGGAAEADRRGRIAATLSQTNHYQITGSNAKEIGNEVEERNRRVWAELTRNFATIAG